MLQPLKRLLFKKKAAAQVATPPPSPAPTPSARAPQPAMPSLVDQTAALFERMEETRNDKITETLDRFLSRPRSPQS